MSKSETIVVPCDPGYAPKHFALHYLVDGTRERIFEVDAPSFLAALNAARDRIMSEGASHCRLLAHCHDAA